VPANTASQRVAERLGAVRDGVRPNSHEADGRSWDTIVYSLRDA
jgi:RimJ/RimL family protein N-acetyltransferase